MHLNHRLWVLLEDRSHFVGEGFLGVLPERLSFRVALVGRWIVQCTLKHVLVLVHIVRDLDGGQGSLYRRPVRELPFPLRRDFEVINRDELVGGRVYGFGRTVSSREVGVDRSACLAKETSFEPRLFVMGEGSAHL